MLSDSPMQSIIKDLFSYSWLITNLFIVSNANAKEAAPFKGLQKDNLHPPMTDIHDIKPLVAIGMDLPRTAILVGTLILVVLLIAFFCWRYFRKSIEVKDVIPELPPEMNAHRAINKISHVTQTDGKLFYFKLLTILRQYLYERFNMNAPEMTTEELLPQIKALNLNKDLLDGIVRLCQSADTIKFAGRLPQIRQMEMDLSFARKFIDGTTLKTDTETKQT
jgi:hypothetical protein